MAEKLAALAPADQDPTEVSRAVVDLVATPKGRPVPGAHRSADDGAEVVNPVSDRVRTEFYRRVGLEDLLSARTS